MDWYYLPKGVAVDPTVVVGSEGVCGAENTDT